MKSIRSSRRMNVFGSVVFRARLPLLTLTGVLTVAVPGAHSAGVQFTQVPADAAGPPLAGVVWSPCATPAGDVKLDRLIVPGTLACPLLGTDLPFIVMSQGYHGSFSSQHDVAEALADAGFVVAAINHPADSASGRICPVRTNCRR